MPEDVATTIRDLMGTVLGRTLSPGEPVSQDSEPGWDSLRHVEMVVLIEDALGVRFDEAELPQLLSLDEFVDAVRRHRAP
jgi:acyl carrier protein